MGGMLWVGVAIAAALVLLLVIRALGDDEDEAAAPQGDPRGDKPGSTASAVVAPGAVASAAKAEEPKKASAGEPPAPDAARTSAAPGKPKGERDEEEPEGSKVASVPPPPSAAEHVHLEPEVEIDLSGHTDEDPTGPQALILVTAVGRTDPGRRRKHNEDAYLVLAEHGVFAIADGMGGYAAGEVASQLAVEVMSEAFKTNTFAGTPDPERPRRGDELCQSIEMANLAILTQARANEAQSGMGTTVVAARFSPNRQRVYLAHVGDSRAYRVRDKEIKAMTTDHTLGAAGITGPSASKLSRAVGIMDTVEVELTVDAPRVGDYYLLCSDGLSKMVPDDMIHKLILAEASDLTRACERLVETANERGGRDNVSVILVRVEQPSARPPEP